MSAVPYVNFVRFDAAFGDEIRAAISRVLSSGIFLGGPEVGEFEQAYARHCGTTQAIGVANGTEALELTLRAWGIGPGDEVIVPANTALPTALAVTNTGARVVLVDVEPDTGLLDPALSEAALTPATRAIIPVHLYGHPADVDRFLRIGARAGVRILEDCAHAHGALYKGRPCGGLTEAAATSFYPTKNLGAFGDGGCTTTNDAELAETLRLLRNNGLTANYVHTIRGFPSRLDALQAAVLNWKLAHLDEWNARRRMLANSYLSELAGVDGLSLPAVRPWATPVWHAFPILVHDGVRDALQRALEENGIGTNVHYRVPVHLQPCYADRGWSRGDFPVSEARSDALLSLPLDPFHTEEEIARVSAAVRAALERLAQRGVTAG